MIDEEKRIFKAPSIGEEEVSEVVDILTSHWITTGPKVERFEEAFATLSSPPPTLSLLQRV